LPGPLGTEAAVPPAQPGTRLEQLVDYLTLARELAALARQEARGRQGAPQRPVLQPLRLGGPVRRGRLEGAGEEQCCRSLRDQLRVGPRWWTQLRGQTNRLLPWHGSQRRGRVTAVALERWRVACWTDQLQCCRRPQQRSCEAVLAQVRRARCHEARLQGRGSESGFSAQNLRSELRAVQTEAGQSRVAGRDWQDEPHAGRRRTAVAHGLRLAEPEAAAGFLQQLERLLLG
jgi:hypothetical protein